MEGKDQQYLQDIQENESDESDQDKENDSHHSGFFRDDDRVLGLVCHVSGICFLDADQNGIVLFFHDIRSIRAICCVSGGDLISHIRILRRDFRVGIGSGSLAPAGAGA